MPVRHIQKEKRSNAVTEQPLSQDQDRRAGGLGIPFFIPLFSSVLCALIAYAFSYAPLLDLVGLSMDLLGAFHLAISTMPKKWRVRQRSMNKEEKKKDDEKDRRLWEWGLWLLFFGFSLQLVGSPFQ